MKRWQTRSGCAREGACDAAGDAWETARKETGLGWHIGPDLPGPLPRYQRHVYRAPRRRPLFAGRRPVITMLQTADDPSRPPPVLPPQAQLAQGQARRLSRLSHRVLLLGPHHRTRGKGWGAANGRTGQSHWGFRGGDRKTSLSVLMRCSLISVSGVSKRACERAGQSPQADACAAALRSESTPRPSTIRTRSHAAASHCARSDRGRVIRRSRARSWLQEASYLIT